MFIFRVSTTKKNAQKYTKWEKMRLVCEELGPTFVKFGQLLSNRSDLLPKDLVIQLERLQDNVPPLPGEIARGVVEVELNGNVNELFAWFEPEAFASASMAQVHKATLKTGERIVLKIQRPGIRNIIQEDIKVMYTLAEMFEKRIPSLKNFDPIGLVRNFEESITKELDFIHESVNVLRFSKNIEEDPTERTTHTLKVYKEYTTTKVLALEFIKGIKISDVSQLEAKGFDCKEIARKLALSYIKQVFQYGFFHADPHPGNFLVNEHNELIAIDFGCIKQIPEEFYTPYFELVQLENLNHTPTYLSKLRQLEIIREDDSEKEIKIIADFFYELLFLFTEPLRSTTFDFSNDIYFSKIAALGESIWKDEQMKKLNGNTGSRHFLYINRTFFGLYNLLHDLRAEIKTN